MYNGFGRNLTINIVQLIVVIGILLASKPIKAQTAESIIEELKLINTTVSQQHCNTPDVQLISNRALNIFLADKTSYLSENGDLSFYTNYVTLNSSTGILTINHNFQKAKGIDEPIKKLFSVGVKANIADGFNASFLDKKFENQLGISLNQTWLGKVKTKVSGCSNEDINIKKESSTINQKHVMDVLRAGIVRTLEVEIKKKQENFDLALKNLTVPTGVQGQSLAEAKAIVSSNFYNELQEEYREKFARLQAETLTKTNHFKIIKTHWTSLIGYAPLAFPKYNVASTLTAPIKYKQPYPFDITLSHTQFWESSKSGKLFITLAGKVAANNSAQNFGLLKTTFTDYRKLGGTDTLHLASITNSEVYVGAYKSFVTPSLRARVVYFSHESHVGLSVLLEQNFGNYNLLSGRLGIPVVLINNKKLPALNIEFQLAYFDLTNKISADRKLGNKTSVGVGVGVPMSRLMY